MDIIEKDAKERLEKLLEYAEEEGIHRWVLEAFVTGIGKQIADGKHWGLGSIGFERILRMLKAVNGG